MEPLAPEIVAFVAASLRSLDDLQVLMLCMESRDRWWDAAAMAREAMISGSASRRALDHLARGNLLDIRITDDVRYTFSPGNAALLETALACAAAYRAHPVALARLVTDSDRRSVRDFADAFRIRRDDNR